MQHALHRGQGPLYAFSTVGQRSSLLQSLKVGGKGIPHIFKGVGIQRDGRDEVGSQLSFTHCNYTANPMSMLLLNQLRSEITIKFTKPFKNKNQF